MNPVRAIIILLAFAASALMLRLVHRAHSADSLTFTRSTTPNVTHILRWGVGTQVYTASMNLGSTVNIVALTNGPWGPLYYVVVALSTNMIESDPSNELLATNRPAAPLLLRMVPAADVIRLEATLDGGNIWKPVAIITNIPVIIPAVTSQLFRASSPP